MMPFKRGAPPACLKKYKQWGRDYAAKRLQNPNVSFYWHQYQNRSINHILIEALEELTANHCAFCDFFPLGAQSRQTIEHFRPKSQYPKLAYVWHNLFLCCDVCQTAKQEKYDKRLLKPDVTGYEFHRYFIVNQTTGEIKPNPRASIEDQERAKITIEFYDLNRTVRKKARLLEWIKADLQTYNLDDLSYRFMFV
jgi:uncharacterized protein (TIGR02646 family)